MQEAVMAATTMLHVRMDIDIKNRATEALEEMGLNVSDAIRVFLTRVAAERAIPFEVKVPNAVTRAAMEEARQMSRAKHENAESLFDSLEGERTGSRRPKKGRVPENV
jgi:DNA-damage-inducible protein J